MRALRSLSKVVLAIAATTSASCFDPVHADQVAALGGEAPGVPEGPTHRPGQPCLTCHGGAGPGSPEWSIAGTVYDVRSVQSRPPPLLALPGVTVTVTDSSNPPKVIGLLSNDAGNFYVATNEYAPTFPVFVQLSYPGIPEPKVMKTRIGRDGGCATCHFYSADEEPTHMPPVFMRGL